MCKGLVITREILPAGLVFASHRITLFSNCVATASFLFSPAPVWLNMRMKRAVQACMAVGIFDLSRVSFPQPDVSTIFGGPGFLTSRGVISLGLKPTNAIFCISSLDRVWPPINVWMKSATHDGLISSHYLIIQQPCETMNNQLTFPCILVMEANWVLKCYDIHTVIQLLKAHGQTGRVEHLGHEAESWPRSLIHLKVQVWESLVCYHRVCNCPRHWAQPQRPGRHTLSDLSHAPGSVRHKVECLPLFPKGRCSPLCRISLQAHRSYFLHESSLPRVPAAIERSRRMASNPLTQSMCYCITRTDGN